ncbi:hypothetical protein L6452_01700 [Arctium lappa]|uniref:Uncharacterized protein n=1 Tax=Arctium lappa TaxID=4217 RepID=A0ACB9FI12_ARCLA|nr:hypothetical protein L6452_01700 [Arctium lappa]
MAGHQGVPTLSWSRLPHIARPPPSPTPQPHQPPPPSPLLFTPRFRATPAGPPLPATDVVAPASTPTAPHLKSYYRNEAPKYKQKTVLVQEAKEKPKKVWHMGLATNYPKSDQTTKSLENSKKQLNYENLGEKIITIN